MNVFVLSTGRCGSMTFERACRHITNYTVAHESRVGLLGKERLNYPPNHIESDNRLSWFLGRLEERFPSDSDVFYVHLKRDRLAVARSYAKRLEPGMIIPAYAHGVYLGLPEDLGATALDVALDYVDTVNANIALFLNDKRNQMTFHIETAKRDFQRLWNMIGAQGDLDSAIEEFDILYNASDASPKK